MKRKYGEALHYIWRVLPIGVVTVMTGALTFLFAFSGISGSTLFGFLAYGVPLSVIASLLLALPLSLVWIILFVAAGSRLPVLKYRATVSSAACSIIGVALFVVLFGILVGDPKGAAFALFPPSLLPVFVGVVLTWRSFSDDRMSR